MNILIIDERAGAMRSDFSNVRDFVNNKDFLDADYIIKITQDGVFLTKGSPIGAATIHLWDIQGEPELSAKKAANDLIHRDGEAVVNYDETSAVNAKRLDKVLHSGNSGTDEIVGI